LGGMVAARVGRRRGVGGGHECLQQERDEEQTVRASHGTLIVAAGAALRASSRDLDPQRLRLLHELPEPVAEVLLAALLGQVARAYGHLDELLDETEELFRAAEKEDGAGLLFDGRVGLERLRVFVAEELEALAGL